MDKLLLKKWSNFKYGARQSNNLLQEVDQYIVDKFEGAVEQAESGRLATFLQVFGNGTAEDPKLRRVMPYSSDDNGKFLNILQNIRYKEKKRMYQMISDLKKKTANVVDEQEILMQYQPYWNQIKKTVQMKKKPLGWREGDEVPTVDVDTVSLSLDFGYKTEKSKGKTITSSIPFFKLLEKYYPNEVEWWQGNKAKGINGRQTFFLNNYKLVEDLAKEANFGYTEPQEVEPQEVGWVGFVVVLTRHPIDVLRMSDFLNIRSCHSPSGEYFSNCQQEVASGGGIIFMIDKEEFDKAFPDGVIPQKGEIFKDRDRGIKGYIEAPEARLRLRHVENTDTGEDYAVPDKRIYGEQFSSFREQTFKYFAELQKDKFIKDGKLVIPNVNDLIRYGGQYEDSGQQNVGSNFAKLVRTAIETSDIEDKVEQLSSKEFENFETTLGYDSIQFGGGDPSEFEENEDHYDEIYQEVSDLHNQFIRGILRSFPNREYFRVGSEIDIYPSGMDQADVELKIYIKFFIPKGQFVSDEMYDDILQGRASGLESIVDDNLPQEGITFRWPDIPYDDFLAMKANNAMKDPLSMTVYYSYNETIGYDDDSVVSGYLRRRLEDFEEFMDKFGDPETFYEIFMEHLSNLGYVKGTARTALKDQIDALTNILEQDDDIDIVNTAQYNKIKYVKEPLLVFTYPFRGKIEDVASTVGLSQEFKFAFQDEIYTRRNEIISSLSKQQSLFANIKPESSDFIINFDDFVDPYIKVDTVNQTTLDKSSIIDTSKVKVDFELTMEITNDMDEQQIRNALAFAAGVANNKEYVNDLAIEVFTKVIRNKKQSDLVTSITPMEETKKQRFRRLLKEYARKNKGLVR